MTQTKRLTITALLLALSVLLANVKFPGILSSISLDAAPALVAAVFLGAGPGMAVGALGHLVSALFGGFPLGGPAHLLVAAIMAGVLLAFTVAYRRFGRIAGGICFVFCNGVLSPLAMAPLYGFGFFLAMVGPLSAAAGASAVVGLSLCEVLKKPWKEFAKG